MLRFNCANVVFILFSSVVWKKVSWKQLDSWLLHNNEPKLPLDHQHRHHPRLKANHPYMWTFVIHFRQLLQLPRRRSLRHHPTLCLPLLPPLLCLLHLHHWSLIFTMPCGKMLRPSFLIRYDSLPSRFVCLFFLFSSRLTVSVCLPSDLSVCLWFV